jgi:Fibronectin type III domain
MSEMTGPPAGGTKILGLKPKTLIIGSVVLFGGVLGFLWWRSRQAKASSSASTGTSASASAGAYNAATLAGLQDELEELLSQQGGSASTGTGAGGGSTLTTTPTTTSNPPPAKTTTPPKTTTPAKKTPAPAMPAAHETKVTATSVTIAWDKVANATSYRVRVTYQSKLVGTPHVVTGTSATISGLAPLRTYTFHVAAIGPGGTSSETNGPAVKTK